MNAVTTAVEEKPKKSSRAKKAEMSDLAVKTAVTSSAYKPLENICGYLSDLSSKVEQAKTELTDSQKRIVEIYEEWNKEQLEHRKRVLARDEELAVARKREEEEYEYQKRMERKKAEDDFNERKASWEKDLQQKKDEIAVEKKELVELRARVASFDSELQKAVKEAQVATAKELEEKYTGERKLREQEVKSEKEILNLRISSLGSENSRQAGEIETLRKALEEATRQVKDIAVKVIEGRAPKVTSSSEI